MPYVRSVFEYYDRHGSNTSIHILTYAKSLTFLIVKIKSESKHRNDLDLVTILKSSDSRNKVIRKAICVV
jgi:hypothetical protein